MTDLTTFAIETLGWIAALLVLGAYILLSIGKLESKSPVYQWMNVVGSAGFIVNSGWNGAIPSATLNLVWMAIGIYALWRIKSARSSTSATSSKPE